VGRVPPVKPADAIRIFEQLGFVVARRKGSHIVMKREGALRPIVVPDHAELAIGTLRSNLRTAGITVDDFLAMLRAH